MKLSPTFYVITGIALVCFVPAYLAMRSDSAALQAEASKASKGLDGYPTPEEEADRRMESFWRDELKWTEQRIQQERLIRVQERVLNEMRKGKP